ncbi:thiosulfate sulfurtransferase [Strongylocentrotus purpuratus]|uniref:Sulfurtransferase n=1 Tax=Strongylocentrotus purpuratus TaxID=7668 RepID=A0A7M7RBG7_STRPU|nr:thiosulfate sulfurtransferase [Strongylocentrotus purpuratus]|eukprot:XP_784437.2 PREDICTED: thiosulfate sulfurtransferase [Strongylocentrotus purpuratus]
MAASAPLVSTKWLSDALGEQTSPSSSLSSSTSCTLRVIDATWLGIMTEGRDAYQTEHVPGSVHFDLNQCRDKTSRLEFTLPSAENFAKYVGELGIDNETHVIVYENDPIFRMMSAPRTWWMFRLFGHDKVSVLDGGLKQWKEDGYAVESGDESVVDQRVFSAKPANPSLLKNFDEVLENQKTDNFTLIDCRQPEWFDGSMDSIWPNLPLGYILKSINVPFSSMVRSDSDRMVAREDILKLFQSAGIDLTQPLVSSCFVGISACTIALAAYVVGKEDVAIYDGSWDEFCKSAPKDSHVIIPAPKL